MIRKWLIFALFLLFGSAAFGQGSQRIGQLLSGSARPIAGAKIWVCTSGATVTFSAVPPCTPQVAIYSDPLLSVPITQPLITDGLGNYTYYSAPGTYTEVITGPMVTGYQSTIVLPCVPGAIVCGTGSILPTNNVFTGGNNFLGNVQFNSLPTANVQLPVTPGDCVNWILAPTLSAVGTIGDGGACGGGGGSGTVVASPQFRVSFFPNAGSSATVQGSNIFTDAGGNSLFLPGSSYTSQNPAVDAINFGARGVTAPITTTATATATLNTVTVASNTGFQIGDGVVLYGAGPTCALSTPPAPTVTPSLAQDAMETGNVVASAAGSTSYSYTYTLRDKLGCMTAQSPAGTTSTGQASLSATTISNSNLVRSNNVVTVTTAAPHNILVGCTTAGLNCPVVYVQNPTDASFSGYFLVTSATDSTHYTYTQGLDTRAGSPVNSATGGTTTVYASNHIALTIGTGYQAYIYKSGTYVGQTRPGESVWDDYGVTPAAPPDFVPTSAPSSATNEYLATTITNIAGMTVTLADAASNSTVSTTFKYDGGPTLLATAKAAAASGTAGAARIQSMSNGACLPINSHTILPSIITVQLAGCLTLNETLELGSQETWTGVMGGSSNSTPQFAWGPGRVINVGTAYPGIAATNGEGTYRDLTILVPNQGLGMTVGPATSTGFNNTFEHTSCSIGASNIDILGQCLVLYGTSGAVFKETGWFTSEPATNGISTAGIILFRNDLTNVNGSGNFHFYHPFFTSRGVVWESNPVIGGGNKAIFDQCDSQGIRTPTLTVGKYNAPFVYFNGCINDTSPEPFLANLGSGGMQATLINVTGLAGEAGGIPGFVSGNVIPGLTVNAGNVPIGQNVNILQSQTNVQLDVPPFGLGLYQSNYFNAPFHSSAGFPLYFDMPLVTGVTATVAAGGSATIGNWNFKIVTSDANGGKSAPSAASSTCTTTSGNQTCNVAWTPVTGAQGYYVYGTTAGGFVGVTACFPVTVASCSFTGSRNAIAIPVGSGAGTSGISPLQVWTPQLVITGPLSGGTSPTATITFSGTSNVTLAAPTSSGTLCTTLSCPGTGTVTATGGPLVLNELVLGNGGVDTKSLPTISAPTKVLHDGLPPAFSFVVLSTDVSGCLPIANGGTNDCSTISAHQFFGNSTGSAAAPANTLIGTSDVTPNECAADTGAVNAYVINPTPAATALVNGLEVCFTPANNNTSASPTLNVSGLGVQTIANPGGTVLTTGQLTTLGVSIFRYNLANTRWEVQGSGGSGSGSGTVNAGAQFSIGQYPNAGTAAVVGPINAPSAPNGLPYTLVSIPAAGAAAQAVFALAGVPGRAVTSGCPDTILYTDRANLVTYAPSGACAVTLPQAGSANFGNNFIALLRVTTNQIVTITPTTSTINGAATLRMGINNFCFIYSIDNANYLSNCTNGASSNPIVADSGAANAYVVSYPLIQVVSAAIPIGSTIFFTVANANTTASTINVNSFGVQSLTKNGAAALIANDLVTTTVYVAFWDGTEWQVLNPSNADLGTFAAHKFLGNNSASTAVAAASFIGSSDVTPNWYAADSGAVNAYVIAPTPALTALTVGATAYFTTANANTGAATINVSSLGVKALDKKGATALVTGDILASPAIYMIVYDGTQWQVVNPSTGSGGGSGTVGNCSVAKSLAFYSAPGTTTGCLSEADASQYQYIADSGAANAYVLTLAPALAALNVGNFVTFTTTHTNTTASTVNVNALGVKNITKYGTVALAGNEILSGVVYVLEWDGTEFQILNPSSALTANCVTKGSADTSHPVCSSITDNGTTVTSTDTGGYVAPVFVANGTTAGFADFPQGTTSAAVAPCNTATSICEQAPASVTSYLLNKPGAAPNIASYKQTDGCGSAICTESFHPVPVLLTVASDFTDSTTTTLTLVTGLSTTLPVSKAVVISAHCALLFDQATAAVSDSIGIGITGTAPTSANASATAFTSASVQATGTLVSLASTTPTAVVTFTPSAITTVWKAELDATVEQPSNATPGVFGIYVATTTGADNFIVKRGSYCSVIYQ